MKTGYNGTGDDTRLDAFWLDDIRGNYLNRLTNDHCMRQSSERLFEVLQELLERIERLEGRSGCEAEEPEILPCPFCGEEVRAHEEDDRFVIECLNGLMCSVVAKTFRFHTRAEAIKAWNTRAGKVSGD